MKTTKRIPRYERVSTALEKKSELLKSLKRIQNDSRLKERSEVLQAMKDNFQKKLSNFSDQKRHNARSSFGEMKSNFNKSAFHSLRCSLRTPELLVSNVAKLEKPNLSLSYLKSLKAQKYPKRKLKFRKLKLWDRLFVGL